jgi:outer membrane protein TolC
LQPSQVENASLYSAQLVAPATRLGQSKTRIECSDLKLVGVVFAEDAELTAAKLVAEVLARNPGIAQMTSAAQAAAARYPQVTSLDDPMLGASFGPASIGSRSVDFAYRIEASQRLPYPGKRSLRGENAQSEARAAGDDVEVTRLQLIESTRAAFYDYYLAERALHVNREGLGLLQELRKDANARYKADTAPEQDYLLADVEIGRQRERQLALERSREVAIARINMLMHQPPDQRLPPPPTELKPGPIPSNSKELREVALSRRPDLRAVANRLEAERAALALAEREYKPDFEAVAAYDTWWQRTDRDLRPMVGLRMNVPVRYARRDGAIAEAAAKLAQRRAEYDRLTDQTNYEVQQAIAQLNESARAARLYQETILPAARENVRAARAGYAATKIPAVSLIEAQRNLIMQRERSYEVIADFFRRQAALERAIGGPVPDSERERLLVPKEPTAP